ncbi:hypothetical protein [Vibrio nigripulchritudo]|nr:hypothetical protein [Vibrio nigripulchritudo]
MAQQLFKKRDAGSIIKAEKLFSKALRISSIDPMARASSCHDLGVLHFSCHTTLPGGTYVNLKKAIRYLNRAVDTRQRQRFPERYASSISQLAATYRRAAHEPLWPNQGAGCLEKAASLHFQAIEFLEHSTIPRAIKDGQLAVIYFNLSSVLFDQGLHHEACIWQARSVELYLDYSDYHLPKMMNVMTPEQALGLGFARLNHFSEMMRHKELCEHIVDIAPSYGLDPLILLKVNPFNDMTVPEQQIDYLVRSTMLDPLKGNIEKLHNKQVELMNIQRTCESDAEADHLASFVQRTCSGIARILLNDLQNTKNTIGR